MGSDKIIEDMFSCVWVIMEALLDDKRQAISQICRAAVPQGV